MILLFKKSHQGLGVNQCLTITHMHSMDATRLWELHHEPFLICKLSVGNHEASPEETVKSHRMECSCLTGSQMEGSREQEEQSLFCPFSSKFLTKNCSYLKEMQEQKWSRDLRKGYPETTPPWDPSHAQTPSLDTIADAKMCLQTGAWYSCPLRGSAST